MRDHAVCGSLDVLVHPSTWPRGRPSRPVCLCVLQYSGRKRQALRRDCVNAGVLMCHLRRMSDALSSLGQYKAWLEVNHPHAMEVPDTVQLLDMRQATGDSSVSPNEILLVDKLLIKLNQYLLEETFAQS